MPETFLILLAGGIMLAAAISDPRAVTLRWLRLAGINASWIAALAGVLVGWRHAVLSIDGALLILSFLLILGQIAFVQVARRKTQRALAGLAFLAAISAGYLMLPQARQGIPFVVIAASILASGALGLSLMDMLLGHAYLNSAQMTMSPFLRLNRALAGVMAARAVLSIGGTLLLQSQHPQEMFWNLNGLYIGTRWLVGFIVAGVFVWMAHDCIKRRATQSATGILYVAGVLIFIGEMIGLYLMSETGMPI